MIESGTLGQSRRALVQQAKEEMDKYDFYLRDESGQFNVDHFCAWVRQRQTDSKGNLHLICLDYIQLLDPVHPKHSEYQRISDITRKLKKLARETRLCILGLSQMNRGGTKSARGDDGLLKASPEPELSDLHGSGSLERDSDGVVFIWSKSPNQSTPTIPVNFKIAKNRKGRSGSFVCEFRRAEGQKFVEVKHPCQTEKREVFKANRMDAAPSDEEDLLA
jgi:replicative DNA helicase